MRVGVLGGGQLGRMLALAGYPLGLRFRFLDPAPDAPVEDLAERLAADLADPVALERFTHGLGVVTYEFENVPVETARRLTEHVPVQPPPEALAASQDRLTEKTLFRNLGLATAPFVAVDSRDALDSALAEIGTPAILKSRRFGYDGKGQYRLSSSTQAGEAWQALGGVPAILEGVVPFVRELSHVSVRGQDGTVAFYPLVENEHRAGILRVTLAPAPQIPPQLEEEARSASRAVLEALDYVGVLAIEFFEAGGRLVANEMAPRVHNSGHWTIEAARTSQFENHLRAILGWPLGPTDPVGLSAMVNLIGSHPSVPELLAVPGAHLHLYGKKPRPGRKLGHLTVWADDVRGRDEALARVRALCPETD